MNGKLSVLTGGIFISQTDIGKIMVGKQLGKIGVTVCDINFTMIVIHPVSAYPQVISIVEHDIKAAVCCGNKSDFYVLEARHLNLCITSVSIVLEIGFFADFGCKFHTVPINFRET